MDQERYWCSLEVVQQPQRARMCGFGDKDRRPITPPPCVKLIIVDRLTGNEVNVSTFDISFFVLTVDLWDENAENDLNLVLHPSSSQNGALLPTGASSSGEGSSPTKSQYQGYSPGDASDLVGDCVGSSVPQVNLQDSSFNSSGQVASTSPDYATSDNLSDFQRHEQAQSPASHAPGAFTRNLIGSLVASAFKLHDISDELGIWFVLQDLSVRTEGTFRLKFNFVGLGTTGQTLLTTGSTPVLCSVFSQPFAVYSAKRFPGMIESTEISRTFASQGIKIPIRKAEA